jgi:hypothetical protein
MTNLDYLENITASELGMIMLELDSVRHEMLFVYDSMKPDLRIKKL